MQQREIIKRIDRKLKPHIQRIKSLFERLGFDGSEFFYQGAEAPSISIQGPSSSRFPYHLRARLTPDFDIKYSNGKDTMRFTTLLVDVGVNPFSFEYPEYKQFKDAFKIFHDNVTTKQKAFKLNAKEADNIYTFIEESLTEVIREADEATQIYIEQKIDKFDFDDIYDYLPEIVKDLFML